jgi:hypothetical protein
MIATLGTSQNQPPAPKKKTLVPASFFLLAIYSQKAKLKTKKVLKSMLFLDFQ